MAARKLEDEFGDIIAKARRGLGLSSVPGVSASELADIESYRLTPDRATILKLAAALKLDGPKLAAIALDGWLPAEKDLSRWGNIAWICSDYGGGTVNCYLHWDAERNAALFDTGVDADAVLQLLAREHLQLRAIFITHHHGDHVAALPEIRRAHPRAELRRQSGNVGALAVEAVNTPGHTADGITYIVRPGPVAYVGDSLFAGSVGAAGHSYAALLQNVRTHIFSLPDDTLLCPGHGPLTTVAEEKAHNPFFP
jgi:hydroxyacylglutathione hydrolase